MHDTDGKTIVGQAVHTQGKSTHVVLKEGAFRGGIERICVVGREEFTLAEKAHDEFLLHLLRGEKFLQDAPFIQRVWFTTSKNSSSPVRTKSNRQSPQFPSLNPSQGRVADAMISGSDPIVMAHGKAR